MKTCTKCGATKQATGFSNRRSRKDGLRSQCKACDAAYCVEHKEKIAIRKKAYRAEHVEEIAARRRAYYAENSGVLAAKQKAYNAEHAEEIAARVKAYYTEHAEEIAAYGKAYRAEHVEEIAAYSKAWRVENAEESAAQQKAWRVANAEEIAVKRAAYRAKNKGKIAARVAAWQMANQEKCAATKRRRRARKLGATAGAFDERLVWKRGGRVCSYCGSTEDLTLDHVVPLSQGGTHSFDNLCVACRSCNSSKGAKPLIEWMGWKARMHELAVGAGVI